ncbi:MAG: DUF2064 domain-containing protein [Frateuria sp.]|nr:DUF2064 domain-containing protein [Frateuria sp.]
MSTALAIFVKTPGHSPLKTRLASAIGAEAATAFYRLAAAAVAAVAQTSRPAITPYWAVAEADAQAHAAWPDFPTLWQGEGELGTRMHRVYDELLGRHAQVLLVGADAPQLTAALLARAASALRDPAVAFALGEARDGGFWLFGGKAPVPLAVWQSVRYSQGDTCAALRRALPCCGTTVDLPTLVDADSIDDLEPVRQALSSLPQALPAQRVLADWLAGLLRASAVP